MRKFLLAALAAILVAPMPALAWRDHRELDDVASWLAQRPVTIHCQTAWETAHDPTMMMGAAAYVPLVGSMPIRPADYAVLAYPWCDVLVDMQAGGSAWTGLFYAIGTLILVHEAGHLRGSTHPAFWDEKAVNCWAARRASAVAILKFGLAPESRPYFDALIWSVYRNQPPDYRMSSCQR